MLPTYARFLLPVISAIAILGCSNEPERELENVEFGAAIASPGNCEFQTSGTSSPPSSGVSTVISETTGTVISANFFNSGAIDPPYFDANEFVSICISAPNSNGNRTAKIITDVGLDNDFNIKGYPQFIVGTKFGNIFETSYRYYQNTGLPEKDQWPVTSSKLSNQYTPFEFANLEYISAGKGVGLPAFTNDLPNISITLDIDEENIIGAERDIMLESWFYDTSANTTKIGNNVVTGLPIANTLNNIVGVGHPHYDELDNTLLEMMVHLGALSPNDVSGASNNPGQNQLTEVFSGKDSDLDGIDDHFDVDSHDFLNSVNHTDPKPGKYSSGIDANGDGIDDADLLPVQFGSHLYSIWYGESFLTPIIIYSRETNTTLQNDFDPNTPDMDLTSEGEIELPWNEFLEYTLTDVQPLLQAAGVQWASNSIFERMSANAGAIGGVEFGVEPQTNNPSDQPYVVHINKFEVNIDGGSFGLLPDNLAPATAIITPALAADSLPQSTTISGVATDSGGAGIDSVQIVIRDLYTAQWFDFNGGFSNKVTRQAANLTNTTNSSVDWSLPVSLQPGSYRIQVIAFDGARNNSGWNRRDFTITAPDTLDPSGTITTPATTGAQLAQATSITGIAYDSGGEGFDSVQIAIRDLSTAMWFDFNGTFSAEITRQNANLTDTTTGNTNWNLPVSLPPGNYRVQAVVFDGARNNSGWIRREFVVTDPDIIAPTGAITNPTTTGTALHSSSTLAGTAFDSGGSGFDSVEIVIRDLSTGQWFDFNGTFSTAITRKTANLTGTTNTNTNWNLPVSLPPGSYRIQALVFDGASNNSGWIRSDFVVREPDIMGPSGSITTPASDGASLISTIAGNSSDLGGSGIESVKIIIRRLGGNNPWFDFNGAFISTPTRADATLFNLNDTSTAWSLPINLPPGNYRAQALVFDGANNNSGWIYRTFIVQ